MCPHFVTNFVTFFLTLLMNLSEEKPPEKLEPTATPNTKQKRKKHKKKTIEKFVMPELPKFEEKPQINNQHQDSDDVDAYFQEIEKRFNELNHHTNETFQDELSNQQENIDGEEETEGEDIELSGTMIKKYGRPTIAMLKLYSRRPELIERNDTNAPDPFTLAEIKNVRNVVPVPSHWSQKRKYLNYKQGSEMSRYRLPPYLEKTGIPQMRQILLEMDEKKSLAAKQRERVKPKTGQFDINPQILYSAFFHQQTKPLMTRFGDVYFEGMEKIPNRRGFRPGHLSQKLREALGMTEFSPPPFLFAMQRYGPPPSYPALKIPGLNAPLPPGCSYGSGENGWGQVPLNPITKTPLFGGNPFDTPKEDDGNEGGRLWGELRRSENICDGVNI